MKKSDARYKYREECVWKCFLDDEQVSRTITMIIIHREIVVLYYYNKLHLWSQYKHQITFESHRGLLANARFFVVVVVVASTCWFWWLILVVVVVFNVVCRIFLFLYIYLKWIRYDWNRSTIIDHRTWNLGQNQFRNANEVKVSRKEKQIGRCVNWI